MNLILSRRSTELQVSTGENALDRAESDKPFALSSTVVILFGQPADFVATDNHCGTPLLC